MNNTHSNRNSLLELYRFLASIWILFIHDYFFVPKSIGYFSRGQMAVDFFFMLSGLFLIRSFNKVINNKPVFKSMVLFDFSRLKKLGSGFAFPISMLCTSIVYFTKMLPERWNTFYLYRINWYVVY